MNMSNAALLSKTTNDSTNGTGCTQCERDDVMGTKEAVSTKTAEPVEVRNLVTNLIGLICNGIALGGLIRQKNFSRQFKVHMVSITLADMQLNIILLVLTAARATGGLNAAPCVSILGVGIFCIICNAGLVLALAIDRVYAVFAPIQYRIQTKAEVKAGIRVALAVVAAIPILLTLFMRGPVPARYCYLFDVTSTHGLLVLGLHVALCGCTTMAIYVCLVCKMKAICLRSHQLYPLDHYTSPVLLDRTRKLTYQSALFVTWFCISYVPFGIYLIYVGSAKGLDRTVEKGTTRFMVLTMSPFLNAVVDPFIVFWHVGVFKTMFRSVRQCVAALAKFVHPVPVLRSPRVIRVQPNVRDIQPNPLATSSNL